MAKEILYDQKARDALLKGVNYARRRSKGDPWAERQERDSGEDLRVSNRYKRRCNSGEGDRVRGQVLRNGRSDGERGASKTSDVAGDGTTTATVLAQAIYREGVKLVAAGHNPMELKRGIEKAVEVVVEELKKLSKPTKDQKEIAQVGTISANNDETIATL